ncbi:MAG: DnaD domain protein [Lachnospiraceae bacterium]|nr:DnaD domain protein [Lachnospiraceae bacterium]
MSRISLCSNINANVTTVPNVFLDEYMVKANGEFLKIYLYLLRSQQEPDRELSVSSIADTFNLTENDVKRALRYWRDEGLIKLSGINSRDGLKVTLNPIEKHIKKTVIEEPEEIPAPPSEDELQQLCLILEGYLGRPLTRGNVETVEYIYNELGFSMDLCDFLFEYCISNRHTNMRYIETVALNWAGEGIDTVEKAKTEIKLRSERYYSVLKAMGRGSRTATAEEIRSIDKWYSEYGFDTDVVLEACNRAVLLKKDPGFAYVGSILKKWKAAGCETLEDVLRNDPRGSANASGSGTQGRNKFSSFPQRNYEFNDMEKLIVNKHLKEASS